MILESHAHEQYSSSTQVGARRISDVQQGIPDDITSAPRSGLPTGGVVGIVITILIVIGGLAIVVLIVIALFVHQRRRKSYNIGLPTFDPDNEERYMDPAQVKSAEEKKLLSSELEMSEKDSVKLSDVLVVNNETAEDDDQCEKKLEDDQATKLTDDSETATSL